MLAHAWLHKSKDRKKYNKLVEKARAALEKAFGLGELDNSKKTVKAYGKAHKQSRKTADFLEKTVKKQENKLEKEENKKSKKK